jgi:hypothetical protein
MPRIIFRELGHALWAKFFTLRHNDRGDPSSDRRSPRESTNGEAETHDPHIKDATFNRFYNETRDQLPSISPASPPDNFVQWLNPSLTRFRRFEAFSADIGRENGGFPPFFVGLEFVVP